MISQVKNYTFNTDGDKEGWIAAGLDLSTSTPNPTGGYLIATGKGSGTGFPQIRSEEYAPLIPVGANQKIKITLVAENATDVTTWQISNLDTGSTNFGAGEIVEFNMPIVALGSGTSTFEMELPVNLDNVNGGISQVSIRAKSNATDGTSGTISFDNISISITEEFTENSYVSNPDFETGDLTNWSGNGGEVVASITTGNGGGSAGQLSFTNDQTKNNFLNNVIYDFGKTVNPSEIKATFNMMSNNPAINVQILYDLYDANDNKIAGQNTGLVSVTTTNTWESFSLNKANDVAFNKIHFRFKVKDGALIGDKVAFDNVTSEFTYITLGINDAPTKKISTMRIYPNPAKHILNIKSLENINAISIYDVTGKQVLSFNSITRNQLNISNLKNGIYVVKMQDSNHNYEVKKLIISK
ncbi:hypothetical protein GCM10023163_29160 [Aestuariibaculum suncheonense]